MRKILEIIGIIVLAIIAVALVVGIISLPLAFVGWAVATVAGLFTPVSVSYWQCVAIGWVVMMLITLFKWWRK